jgi:polyphenol oxidase
VRDGPLRARFTFTDRHGGLSTGPYASLNLGEHVGDDVRAVHGNRRILSHRLGVPEDRFVWMRQVHGARVAIVDSPGQAAISDVDAIVTAVPGLALGVLVADCVPVVLADDNAGVIGAAHAGRRGMSEGIVTAAITAMQRLGAEPERLRAVLGPAICASCYEVSAALRDSVANRVPRAVGLTRGGAPALDLAAGIRDQLRGVGVDRVQVDGRCTVEDAALFSYRRNGITGRQAGVVWLEPG